jgi:predicted dehydrogenase
VRIGFIGAGLIATFHSKSLRHSGVVVERAGVFDPDTTRAEAFAAASGHTVMPTEDAVFDSCDAVYICTWTSEHPRLVAEAARRGLHVFCEKPLATSLPDAEAMLAEVTRAGVTHQVGLILRRSPAYLWAHHLVHEPAAGRVMAVVFRDDQFIPIQGHYSSTWRQHRELAGAGTLLEHSIHDVDMLRYVVGDITSVSARQANFHGHEGIEDVVSASLSFAGGGTGTLVSVWHDNLARPSLRRVEIFCERRFVVIEGDDWFGPVTWTDSDGSSGTMSGDEIVEATRPMIDGDANPDGAFVRACQEGSPAWPDFAIAVEAHRVVDAMYSSATTDGDSVRLAPA